MVQLNIDPSTGRLAPLPGTGRMTAPGMQNTGISQNYYTPGTTEFGWGGFSDVPGTVDQPRAQADELAQNYAMREQQLLAGQQAMDLTARQFESQQEQARLAAQFAQDFLSQWNQSAAETKGIFNTAMASIEELQPFVDKISEYGDDIGQLITDTQADLATYREKYSPLETKAMETSMMALGTQQEMMGQLQELSRPDYAGVSGRAKADVGMEAELGRRAEARSLQGFGLDPTSGRYRGSMRSSRVSESLNKVLAANAARIAEKNRVTGVVQGGLQVVDPSKMGGDISKQIQTGGMDYSKLVGSLAETGAGVQKTAGEFGSKLATTQAGLAESYGKTMMPQYGEGFMSMLGTGMVTDPRYMQDVGTQAGIQLPQTLPRVGINP